MGNPTTKPAEAMRLLHKHRSRWFTAQEVCKRLRWPSAPANISNAGWTLSMLAKRGHLEKSADGKYSYAKGIEFYVGAGGKLLSRRRGARKRACGGPRRAKAPIMPKTREELSPVDIEVLHGINDEAILTDALLYFAAHAMEAQPMRALRAAFMAGERKSKVRLATVEMPRPQAVVATAAPELPAELPKMPKGMTYRELVGLTEQAYQEGHFTYAQVAALTGKAEDFVRKVCCGETLPTRATQEAVYGAVEGLRRAG